MHRSRGNVVGSEERKSLNPRVVGSTGVGNNVSREVDSSGKSSGIGSEEGELVNNSSPLGDNGFLPDQDDRSSSDDEWPEGGHPRITGEDSLILVQLENQPDSLQQPNLSSRFFQPRSRSGSSPPGKGGKERAQSPETSKERFKGAKQLFLSLERRRSKERKKRGRPGGTGTSRRLGSPFEVRSGPSQTETQAMSRATPGTSHAAGILRSHLRHQ